MAASEISISSDASDGVKGIEGGNETEGGSGLPLDAIIGVHVAQPQSSSLLLDSDIIDTKRARKGLA